MTALTRRLAPLYAAAFLQNLALWVPIEKLFMTSIGFDAAGVGLMAAMYSAVVPLFEVPSGILADRWSRRGVLVLASCAAILSVTIGGFSRDVPTYLVAALFIGAFFAMQSGTFESVVYDTVVEETGASDGFERMIGRARLVESAALVASALAGGAIAEFAPLRVTYFLTAPLLAGACLALAAFREPRLHKATEATPLREQLRTTYRTILRRGHLRPIIALTVAGALLMQGMLEFGPLWLVALAVPAFLYGPHWAGLTSALGLGGLLGAQAWLTRRWAAVVLAAGIVGCCVVLAVSRVAVVVVAAQVLMTLLVVAAGIPVTRRLHDGVPSSVRAGVASGVSTLTWLTFVPFALLMGFLSNRAGISETGWLLAAIAVAAGALIILVLPEARPAPEPTFPVQRFLPDDHPQWPGHWSVPPQAWQDAGIRVDGAGALAAVRAAIAELPESLRQVLVLRDVEGRTPADVQQALGIRAEDGLALLHQARGHVRTRLEQHFEGNGRHDR